jgi:6-phosphofructokinase 1
MSMLCASRVDLEEAEAVGRAAVRLALAGMTDCMVTIVRDADEPYRSHTESADLAAVANVQRVMPAHYISQDRPGITDDFRSYALPLLGPDPLPHYARLDDVLGI